VLLLSFLVLSQNLVSEQGHLVGGLQKVKSSIISSKEESGDLIRSIENFARDEFAKSNSGQYLGPLVDVIRQLVAGFNYRLTFNSGSGQVLITVFDQPWTSTRQITSMEVKHA
jgi:hypothetical protein